MPLFDELIQRALTEHPELSQPAPKLELNLPQSASHGELSPALMMALGSVADGASTYNFMRHGIGEDNAAFQGLGGKPIPTSLAVAGSGLAGMAASKLLGRKLPSLARVLMANQAAQSIGVAGQNFTQPTDRKDSSFDTHNQAVTKAITRSTY